VSVHKFSERFGTPIFFHRLSMILFDFFFHSEDEEDSIGNNAVDSHEIASYSESDDAEDDGGGNGGTDVGIAGVLQNGIADEGGEQHQEQSPEGCENASDLAYH